MSAEVPLHQSPSLLLLHFLLSNVIQKNSARRHQPQFSLVNSRHFLISFSSLSKYQEISSPVEPEQKPLGQRPLPTRGGPTPLRRQEAWLSAFSVMVSASFDSAHLPNVPRPREAADVSCQTEGSTSGTGGQRPYLS